VARLWLPADLNDERLSRQTGQMPRLRYSIYFQEITRVRVIGTRCISDRQRVRLGNLDNHLCQDARNAGSSDPSNCENNTGIISFIVNLPRKSFSATTSCWASGRPTGISILPPALS
jgi:hypothetical protein